MNNSGPRLFRKKAVFLVSVLFKIGINDTVFTNVVKQGLDPHLMLQIGQIEIYY